MYLFLWVLCFHVHHMCVWYPQRQEEGARSPGTEATDSCELLCGYQKSNSGPLEEQSVLSASEASLQPPSTFYIHYMAEGNQTDRVKNLKVYTHSMPPLNYIQFNHQNSPKNGILPSLVCLSPTLLYLSWKLFTRNFNWMQETEASLKIRRRSRSGISNSVY